MSSLKSIFSRKGLGPPGRDHSGRAVSAVLADLLEDRGCITPEGYWIVLSEPCGLASVSAGRLRNLRFPQNGESAVAMNLATVRAESGKRKVMLIEGGFHRRALANDLGLSSYPGAPEGAENGTGPLPPVRILWANLASTPLSLASAKITP